MTGSASPAPTPARRTTGPLRTAVAALWIATALAFSGMWVWGLCQTPLTVHETILLHTEPVGEIRGAQTVGQTFRAPYNGLHRIEVALADYGRLNTAPLNFRLGAGPEASDFLVSQSLPATAIRGDVTQAFEFAPLTDSAGRVYYFQLDAPEAAPGNAITAYVRPEAAYPDGAAYRAGEPVEGDLVFSLYFKVGFGERLKILLRQMTANRPSVWGDWRFYVGGGLVYAGLLVLLARQLARFLSRAESEEAGGEKE